MAKKNNKIIILLVLIGLLIMINGGKKEGISNVVINQLYTPTLTWGDQQFQSSSCSLIFQGSDNNLRCSITIKNTATVSATYLLELIPDTYKKTGTVIRDSAVCDPNEPQRRHTLATIPAGQTHTFTITVPSSDIVNELGYGTYYFRVISYDSCCNLNPSCTPVSPFGDQNNYVAKVTYHNQNVCDCTGLEEQGCGQGPCADNEMYSTQTCTPNGCDVSYTCVFQNECASTQCSNPTASENTYACRDGDVDKCVGGSWIKQDDCSDYTGYTTPCLRTVIRGTESQAAEDCTSSSGCTNGQTKVCMVNDCPGTQTCSNNAWGSCVKNDPNCGTSGEGITILSDTASVSSTNDYIIATFQLKNEGGSSDTFLLEAQTLFQDTGSTKKSVQKMAALCDSDCKYNIYETVTLAGGQTKTINIRIPMTGKMPNGEYMVKAVSATKCMANNGGGVRREPYESDVIIQENLKITSGIASVHDLCSTPYCGDGICQSGDCTNCPGDCTTAECATPPPGGETNECMAFLQVCKTEGGCQTDDKDCIVNPMMYWIGGLFALLIIFKMMNKG